MNIDNVTGKQLGIAIAQQLMGWEPWDAQHTPSDQPTFSDQGGKLALWENGIKEGVTRWWAPWRDITDAFEVVAAVRQQKEKCWVRICNLAMPPDYVEDGWDVTFHQYGKPLIERGALYGHAIALELPESICRAALKAVENREELFP